MDDIAKCPYCGKPMVAGHICTGCGNIILTEYDNLKK